MKGQAFSTTDKKALVNLTLSLVKDGESITRARKIVARDQNISPNTLWTWQRDLNLVTPNAVKTIGTVKTTKRVVKSATSNAVRVHNLGDVKTELGNVLTSLIRKDGTYSNQDANTISHLTGSILNISKHELSVHKYKAKISNRDKNSLNLLG